MSLHRTHIRVVSVDTERAYVLVPAWSQPEQPVRVSPRALPAGVGPDDWMIASWNPCGADGSSLYLSDFERTDPPPTPIQPWFGRRLNARR